MDLEQISRRLREQGLKLTPQRIEIIKALMAAGEPQTAQQVLQAVRRVQPHISLDTVYRNLTMLTQNGLVNQINLQNRESARFELQGDDRHHHHAVCLSCGKSYCIPLCPEPLVRATPAQDPQFRVVSHAYEVYGYCSSCQQAG